MFIPSSATLSKSSCTRNSATKRATSVCDNSEFDASSSLSWNSEITLSLVREREIVRKRRGAAKKSSGVHFARSLSRHDGGIVVRIYKILKFCKNLAQGVIRCAGHAYGTHFLLRGHVEVLR